MNIIEDIISSKIQNIRNEQTYKNIINYRNNLIGYDGLNRILIELQCSNALDVRTEYDWEKAGAEIKDYNDSISVLIPYYKLDYVYVESGEICDLSDMSLVEIEKAEQYNIITKEKHMDYATIVKVYNINNIKYTSKVNYTRKIRVSELIKAFTAITGARIEKCDETYFSESDSILFLDTSSNSVIVKSIAKEIADKIFKDNKLEHDTLIYSICSIFNIESDIRFNYMQDMDINDIISCIINNNNIIENILKNIDINANFDVNNNIIHSIGIDNKAKIILSVMEANEILNKMKGLI